MPECAIWGFLTPVSTPQPRPKGSAGFRAVGCLGAGESEGRFACSLPGAATITSEDPVTGKGPSRSVLPHTCPPLPQPFCPASGHPWRAAKPASACVNIWGSKGHSHPLRMPWSLSTLLREPRTQISLCAEVHVVGGRGPQCPCHGFRPRERENGPPKTWIGQLLLLRGSELRLQGQSVPANQRLGHRRGGMQRMGEGGPGLPLCLPRSAFKAIPAEMVESVNLPHTCCMKYQEKVLPRKLVAGYRKALNCHLPAIM